MDLHAMRRVLPVVYGLLIVVVAIFAPDALVAVVVVGAVLLGLFYVLTGRRIAATGAGRDRARRRR